jgi:hypothetical protein
MYCGHCGVAVDDNDVFCRACGARFADEPTVTSFAPPAAAAGTLGGLVAGSSVGPGVASDVAPPSPPTELLPFVASPRPPANDKRPLLIGGAFALVVLAGIGAFFLLRKHDDASTGPLPSVVSTPVLPTSSVLPPVATVAPTLATALPSTVPSTLPATEVAPTTVPETTVATPASTTTPTVATTLPPTTAGPTSGTVAPSGATIPSATVVTATTAPAGSAGAPTVGAVAASSVRQDSFDSCGNATSYVPGNLIDGRLDTAWMAQGDGVGDTITFTFDAPSVVSTVGLVPGYAKTDPCTGANRFTDRRRITKVRWTFDGGSSVVQDPDPTDESMQTITLPNPISTGTVKLTVLATTAAGNPGMNYTSISEVTLS